jgi:hypothetical protein
MRYFMMAGSWKLEEVRLLSFGHELCGARLRAHQCHHKRKRETGQNWARSELDERRMRQDLMHTARLGCKDTRVAANLANVY